MNSAVNIWVLISISFAVYFLISFLYKTLRLNNLQQALPKMKGLSLLNLKHFIGIVLFGIVFYMACPDLGYLIKNLEVPRLSVLIPFFLIVLLCTKLSVSSAGKVPKDEFNVIPCHPSCIIIYFTIRLLYLLSYEFFFRGVLFYSFLDSNSLLVSILYTTLLYVVIHLFDSKKEILGAIPFGIVLGLFTYYSNNIWLAFLIHATLSLAYEISVFNNLNYKTQKS